MTYKNFCKIITITSGINLKLKKAFGMCKQANRIGTAWKGLLYQLFYKEDKKNALFGTLLQPIYIDLSPAPNTEQPAPKSVSLQNACPAKPSRICHDSQIFKKN